MAITPKSIETIHDLDIELGRRKFLAIKISYNNAEDSYCVQLFDGQSCVTRVSGYGDMQEAILDAFREFDLCIASLNVT